MPPPPSRSRRSPPPADGCESVLEATGDRPDVSWAVDPWLVKVATDGWTTR